MKTRFIAACTSFAFVAGAAHAAESGPAAPLAPERKLRHLPDYDTMPPLSRRGMASEGWGIHDFKRPNPKAVKVGEQPSPSPPADALVLFDGKAETFQAQFAGKGWPIKDGALATGRGDLTTRKAFGDCQLHLEWRATDKMHKEMCNSGVMMMGDKYEIQIIDSCEDDNNLIPADAVAGALYGWMPPAVNPMRPAGQWNTYDITFHRPHFDDQGACVKKARVTLFFNGVLAQDNVEFPGPTWWLSRPPYKKHADKLPFSLQSHGGGVEFRNIWVRELE